MIIETLFSTLDPGGEPSFAPMGIVWGEEFLTVRPFRDTHTCRNLIAAGCGVASLSDDVLAFVQAGLYHRQLSNFPARVIRGVVFAGACSWRELEVVSVAGSAERAEIYCRVVHRERQREFLGYCRAGSAILEAAILATRIHLLPRTELLEELQQTAVLVEKTGGDNERLAFELVQEYIRSRIKHD